MKAWAKKDILAEVRRQIGWSVATVARMTDEGEDIDFLNAPVLARRKKYHAKNNGKGRPPKKLRVLPETKLLSLVKNKVVANFLAGLILRLEAAPDPLSVLEEEMRTDPQLIHRWKLNQLITMFRRRAEPSFQKQVWSEKEVRHYFEITSQTYTRKIAVLGRLALRKAAEKIEFDRHCAMQKLLDQILGSNHLSSPDSLTWALAIWRKGSSMTNPLVPAISQLIWEQAIGQLVYDLYEIFEVKVSLHADLSPTIFGK